jgi:two-component system OmpR family sensor kinase
MGDPTRLRQVIDNLLANVRAHTPEGTATTVHVGQEGTTAEVVVKDAGPGMPTDQAARVFERFYRVDASRARGHGGSGLGLSIVAAIVAAHGGTVSASSGQGQGMTVTVCLPVIAELVEPEETGSFGAGAGGGAGAGEVAGPGEVGRADEGSGPNGASGEDQLNGAGGAGGSGGSEIRRDRMTGTPLP